VGDLRALGPDAIVFATGAQGTKTIGVEGDGAAGVFHAKDLVYHYNQLPGFSERPFDMGERVCVIGIGDVMVDIAHWLIRYKKVREVTAVVRRGPAERKYNPKETHSVCANIDKDALAREFSRIRARLEAARTQIRSDRHGRRIQEVRSGRQRHHDAVPVLVLAPARVGHGRQPRSGPGGREHPIGEEGRRHRCQSTDTFDEIPCDSVVFAVGDCVDDAVGLPYKNGMFTTNSTPSGNDPDDAWFQVFDEATGKVIDGVFVTGWARKASEGLVGIAKRDGEWCAEVVQRHLASRPSRPESTLNELDRKLRTLLESRQSDLVTKHDLQVLAEVEREEAAKAGLEEFKFPTNPEMIAAIRRRRSPVSGAECAPA
jgi:ferredoxin--NADP+ reductase